MAYSDIEKAEALTRLALNGNDYVKTSKETGISRRSLMEWQKSSPKTATTIAEGLEAAIRLLLSDVPKMKGTEWGVTLGILLDKWLLMSGQPTSRTESLTRQVNELSDDEYRAAIAEAERIINDASTRSISSP